jgi:hypothetical protein
MIYGMGNLLIYFGAALIIIGVVMNFLSHSSLPLLPGDILIHNKNFTFYFPIVSSIIISVIFTIIFNLFK